MCSLALRLIYALPSLIWMSIRRRDSQAGESTRLPALVCFPVPTGVAGREPRRGGRSKPAKMLAVVVRALGGVGESGVGVVDSDELAGRGVLPV